MSETTYLPGCIFCGRHGEHHPSCDNHPANKPPHDKANATALFDVAEPEMQKSAEFSDCRAYRYVLRRSWDWQGYANQVMFVGLNPSTADEVEDDPTIRRCIGFAKSWGFGGLLMMNAYAFRATDPKVMKAATDPIGPDNDEALSYRATQVGLIVACWGAHCERRRERQVLDVLGKPVKCLGKTKAGHPKHPLYLAKDTDLEAFDVKS